MSTPSLPAHPPRRNRYLLMRHGHSEANARGLIISTPERGLAGFGLSSQGQAQLAELLDDWRWPRPERLLHSDFRRTTETAERVARHFGLAPEPHVGLRERSFGTLEGLADSHYAHTWTLDAEDPEHQAFGVESVTRVANRLLAVIADLEAQAQGQTILLVSHGDPLQILLTALEGRPLSAHRDRAPLAPASITLLP
ncbi:histidine phosphatase family protein [Halomonas alkalicola]|uniref:Histidine phosphatase family protein n=1 Tax=Halomonas alkalicola TaxID=1930622 RepID=A0ABY9H1N1_9GAMM|nr:histidine phosphatase family protein [Halomonas alkalicola]WLI72056.1 histidine phosphatase family protein [Halomonas alkalicola]